MRVVPTLVWMLEAEGIEALDPRLMPLLRAIAVSTSLKAAAADCRISYRTAWGLLRDYQRKLGEPLVLLERGRGASLSPSGERMVGVERSATQRLARILPGLTAELDSAPPAELQGTRQELQVAASHDLALSALATELPDRYGLSLKLQFMRALLSRTRISMSSCRPSA